MIKTGTLEVDGIELDIPSLNEKDLVKSSLAVVEDSRYGVHSSFLLRRAQIEGAVFNVRFFFCQEKLLNIQLHLVRTYGPEWAGKEWEEEFLVMQGEAHAEWLAQALSDTGPTNAATFVWGTASVVVDLKGGDASILLTPAKRT